MRRNQNHQQFGFTVVELLVVFLIMILLSSLVIMNWNNQRSTRNLTIAHNELITNIRKVQSYAVSSRNTPENEAAKFYLIKFENGSSNYNIEAVTADFTIAAKPIEQVTLPANITVSRLVLIDSAGQDVDYNCTYLIFSVVYGKSYFSTTDNCSQESVIDIVKDPVQLAELADYDFAMSLTHTQTSAVKSLLVDGQTGRIQSYDIIF